MIRRALGTGRVSRRDALRLGAVGAAAAAIAACRPAPAGGGAPAPSAALTPKAGGTLNVLLVGDTSGLRTVHNFTSSDASRGGNVTDKLLGYDEKRNPVGALAETWDMSADGKELKLN